MNIAFKRIRDAGDFQKERIVLSVSADADVGNYVVLIMTFAEDGAPYAGKHVSYWFPDKKVKSGDLVVLYIEGESIKAKTMKTAVRRTFFIGGWQKHNSGSHKRELSWSEPLNGKRASL